MPTATVSKHLVEENADETSLKKNSKPLKEHEVKKAPVQQTDVIKVQESEGECPTKKQSKPKKLKEKCVKSSLSTIADAVVVPPPSNITVTPSALPSIPVPKKNAQRAKGSLSLNKTIEQADQTQHQDKPLTKDSTDKIVVSKPEMAKPPGEGRKGSARPQRRKPKSNEEKEIKPVAKQKASSEEGEEKTNGDSPEMEIMEVENPAPELEEKKMEEMQVPPLGLSSCSFLEKIQQGVKAYFTSRSTINSDERSKKGGGIRTRASVAKGVKEDAKKKEPGFKLKNNISYSERNLLQDQLRVDSGGESCNFSDSNPKTLQNFQKATRKKLYQPKSHYVRIQIPRKGYFYRSNVQFQSPESKSSCRFQRSLPRGHQESKSKSPITGLAPSSSQISRLPNKKRLRKSVKNYKTDVLEHLGNYISDCFSEKYLEWLKSRLEDHTLGVNFEEKIKKYVSLNLSDKTVECEKFMNEPENSETRRNGPPSAGPENFKKCTGKFPKNVDVSSDSDGESVPPVLKTEPLFEKIFNCINANLEREGNVDQVNLEKGVPNSASIDENPTVNLCAFEECTPETINRKSEESLPLVSDGRPSNSSTKFCSRGNFLMGGIDLHVELQNYLKAFRGSKNRTKISWQCHSNFPTIHMSNPEIHITKDDFLEMRNKKTCSSTSIEKLQYRNSAPLRVFFDLHHDLRQKSKDFDSLSVKPFISQIQMFGKFEEVRRIKSENDSRKLLQESKLKNTIKRTVGRTSFPVHGVNEITRNFRKLAMYDSNDSYEKISPFRKTSDSAKKSESNLLHSLSTDFGLQNLQKDSSDSVKPAGLLERTSSSEIFPPQLFEIPPKWSPTLYDLVEIYDSILQHNRKITKNSSFTVDRSLSSDVISYFTTKVKEKHCKTKLIDLSKDYFNYYKVPKLQKLKKTKDLCGLEECVSAFQEILHSPLTISQIAYMNNIISGLQETSTKISSFVQDFKTPQKKKYFVKKAKPKSVNSKSFVTKRSKEPPKAPQRAKSNKTKKPIKPSPLKEQIKKIRLETPTELEIVLNVCFNSDAMFEYPATADMQEKIKLDVNMSGNKILVNELSFFNNEKALTRKRHQRQESSELILENVTRETRDGIWYKHNKASKIRLMHHTKEKVKTTDVNKQNFSPVKPRTFTQPNNLYKPAKPKISKKPNDVPPMTAKEQKPEKNKPQVGKNESPPPRGRLQTVLEEEIKSENESDSDIMTENVVQQSDPTKFLQFEYDQLRLRTQHPIEAIVESSESKIIEEQSKSQARKKEDTSHETDVTKPQMQEALEKDVIVKACELDCKKDEPERKTIQKKQKPTKQNTTENKTVSKMRSMVNLEKNLKTKVSSMRLLSHRTYKCHPSSNTTLDKIPKEKSNPKKEDTKKRPKIRSKAKQSTTVKSSKIESNKRETERWKKKKLEKTLPPSLPQKRENSAEELSKQEVPDISKTSDRIGTTKSLVNAVLCLNNDIPSDADSLEFPLSENQKDANFDVDSEGLFVMKPNDTFLIVGPQESTTSKSSENAPITLYPKNSHVDEFSFFSEVIHSDSFLTNLPNPTVSQSHIRSLAMSKSDLKFCPGRVTDNSKDFTPLITFVLTPSQSKLKGVPSNAVEVVRKNKINENKEVPVPDQDQKDQKDRDPYTEMNKKLKETYDVTIRKTLKDESQLKPVEDFIKLLSKAKKSKSQKLERKKVEFNKKRVTLRTTKVYPQMKTSSLSCLSQITFNCNGNTFGKGVKKSKSKIEGKPAEKYMKIPEKNKKEPEEKNKPMSSDLLLNKTVNTLLNTLENFQKGAGNEKSQKVKEKKNYIEEKKKEESIKEKIDEKKSDEMEDKRTKEKCNSKKIELTNSTLEVEEMVENAISQAKDVSNKEGIIAAVKEGLGQVQLIQNAETDPKNKSKIKALMIKVFKIRPREDGEVCEEKIKFQQDGQTHKRQESQLPRQEECQPSQQPVSPQYLQGQRQTDVLDLLVSRETEDLKRKNSTYFDAEEKNEEEKTEEKKKEVAANQHQHLRTVGDTFYLNEEFIVKRGSESNIQLFSKIDFSKDTEEEIFDEILKYFEEGKISLAMTLLDDIFTKMNEISDCDTLKRLLVLTEKKCKSLIMKVEKNAWFKVLTLLEEVLKTLEGQKEDLAVSQLETTKNFVDKIRLLNLQRLNNLQKFWSTFSQSEDDRIKHSNSISIANILNKIKAFSSLKFFKPKINETLNPEKPRSESGFQVNWTSSIQELPEAQKEIEIQNLKKKLRQQKLYIEELMNAEDYTVFGEIQEIKSKIIEKINGLEKAFECQNLKGFKATSSSEMTDSLRNELSGPSTSETPFSLNGNFSYIDLVKSLIKAWDASMPFRTFSSECFS